MKLQKLMEEIIETIDGGFPSDGRYQKHFIGNFNCCSNKMTSLQYGPTEVTGSFYCDNNNLMSLQYGPTKVTHSFNCANNPLSILTGMPRSATRIFMHMCKFTSLKGIHKFIDYCTVIHIDKNPIRSHLLGLLKIKGLTNIECDVYDEFFKAVLIIKKYLNQPMSDDRLEACREELIDNNLEEYALE